LLTYALPTHSLLLMEVPLSSDLQAKLARLATEQGRPSESLAVEAIERLVNYDEWFMHEVNRGLEEAERGELIEHSEVRRMIDKRYPG